jgi:hypothetical protein
MNGVRTRCTAPQVLDYRYYFVIQCAPSTRASIQHAPLQNNRRTASVDPNQMGMCVPRTIFQLQQVVCTLTNATYIYACFACAYKRGEIKNRRKIAAGWSFAEFNYTHPAAKHVLRDKLVCVIVHGRLCVAGVPLVEHGVGEKVWILIATSISLIKFITKNLNPR